ncbi:copper homeostasis protein (lipoprotein nlpE) [Escherichia coli]|uniref:Copper homeostasis protein (Lipoprotein nlpE) n=1 Tax=Escherichia coli TaxID=562 RepID=A0A377DK54_ECOLX|nr:copper homeostasis protein (lipoprotein nlpE) [Escherichia coli]
MVANNAELERSYLAARGHSEKPVLLSVEGHFTLEGNPDTGAPTKVWHPDTAGKFYPNQDCSSLGAVTRLETETNAKQARRIYFNILNLHVFCRPDKAFTPHPAMVLNA